MRKRRALIFHHKTSYRRGVAPIRHRKGWVIRYRDLQGRFTKYDKRKVIRAEFYVFRKALPVTKKEHRQVKEKDRLLKKVRRHIPLTSVEAKKAIKVTGWDMARVSVLKKARQLAKQVVDKFVIREKAPIVFKYIYMPYLYFSDTMKLNPGNYVEFWILIGVEISNEYEFLVIRKTVLLERFFTPLELWEKREMFDDLGRDYVKRQGHIWRSTEVSPQIANVIYVGFLGFHLSEYKL